MKKTVLIFLVFFQYMIFSQNYMMEQVINFGSATTVAFDFMPAERVIVTYKTSSARIFSMAGQQLSIFWNFTDSLIPGSECGVLGVCLDPDFSSNHYIYIYYVHLSDVSLRVVRLTENNNLGTNPVLLFKYIPVSQDFGIHVGGNLKFGPLNKLFITIGNCGTDSNSQSLKNPLGKIIRINSDGSIPSDNPFYDDGNPSTGNDDRIWAYGLRNTFDFTFSPVNDSIYASENGNFGNDEINFIKKGKNYGYPICQGFCFPFNPLYKQPMDVITTNGYAPTGILFYTGSQMPELVNKIILTGAGYGIYRGFLKCDAGNAPFYDTITSKSIMLSNHGYSTLKQGSDGFIYALNLSGKLERMRHNPNGINNSSEPAEFTLNQNYPNPFNPETTIRYSVPKGSFVSLQIFDVLGRELYKPVYENKARGSYEVIWNAENYPSGVYFYRLTAGEFSEEKKMVLIK